MPHLTPIQTARAIAKLEENWSLASVARKLHCIFNLKKGWQKNRLARSIRIGVGKIPLLKFTFTLICINYFSTSFLLKIIYYNLLLK
jgi:hypothetical protein